MKLPNFITNIYFCGDIHGNFGFINYLLRSGRFENVVIFFAGDVGLGFTKKYEYSLLKQLSNLLKKKNVIVIFVRGNHDDPSCYQDKVYSENKWWYAIEDYTIVQVNNENILCIGGAISIDRLYRDNDTYWSNENIIYKPKINDVVIDGIVSHDSPSFCFPISKSSINAFIQKDPKLEDDINTCRNILSQVYEDYQDLLRYWFYGHYHNSHVEYIDDIRFQLLGIEEIVPLHSQNYFNDDN